MLPDGNVLMLHKWMNYVLLVIAHIGNAVQPAAILHSIKSPCIL